MRWHYRCPSCGRSQPPGLWPARCACGSPLLAVYEFVDEGGLRERFESRPPGVWRYLELLPRLEAEPVSMGEGGTYLQEAVRLRRRLGLKRLYIKNEATNPTGSFLDRGATVEVTAALSAGASSITCIAPGNLAVSAAAYSARAELPCRVYFRPGAEQAKILQALAYDAEVAFAKNSGEILKVVKAEGSYPITPSNPLLLEGLKTCTLEILEGLGWRAPDWIFISVGSGGHLTAAWKAVREAEMLGLLHEDLPRIMGAQVEECAPLVEAYRRGEERVGRGECVEASFPDIAVPEPARGDTALRAVRESGGKMLAVSEQRVLEAMRILAKTEGILAEPAAAVALAALIEALEDGLVKRDETTIYVVTGSGMKDPLTTRSILNQPLQTIPSLSLGETKMKILRILAQGSLHGYGVWRKLSSKFGLRISLPTVYQHLGELLSSGLIQSTPPERGQGGRIVRRYFLTTRGRRVLGIS